jgi:hypothetical protein
VELFEIIIFIHNEKKTIIINTIKLHVNLPDDEKHGVADSHVGCSHCNSHNGNLQLVGFWQVQVHDGGSHKILQLAVQIEGSGLHMVSHAGQLSEGTMSVAHRVVQIGVV